VRRVVCRAVAVCAVWAMADLQVRRGAADRSMFAGFMTSLVTNPVDVVRTRIMTEYAAPGQPRTYSNPFTSLFRVPPPFFVSCVPCRVMCVVCVCVSCRVVSCRVVRWL
jgi:hypothetical protein